MKIIFRVDASILIGTGHVMRCLTLANYLVALGHKCIFICRAHEGHLGALIQREGHQLHLLVNKAEACRGRVGSELTSHAHWLGVHWSVDSVQTVEISKIISPDWIIVDHYALDYAWERDVRPFTKKLLIIDDLADRKHECDFLLDQQFGRRKIDYIDRVPSSCKILCGPEYALIRNEFSELREISLQRRESQVLSNILINLGGIDKDNYTSRILELLGCCVLPELCTLTVVIGAKSPWIGCVKDIANSMHRGVKVLVGVDTMAQLMCEADLAIGASGSTAWERCCIGLPTIQAVIADNQLFAAESLARAGAIKLLSSLDQLPDLILSAPDWMESVSSKCRMVTDGNGVKRVTDSLRLAR